MLKDLFASTIHQMLEAELDKHLGYDRYDNKNKNTKNSRNGYEQPIYTYFLRFIGCLLLTGRPYNLYKFLYLYSKSLYILLQSI
ncbi:transposase [Clostridioides difficile]|nr:transposase [Clostridioides difficile]UUC40411.1 transposase [Clostridioides difficile]UWD42807.1 transposase [Clostridioides difficile]UWD46396.1 transposase [Clostridioides difficile]